MELILQSIIPVQQKRELNTFVTCSDSLYALQSLQNGFLHNSLVVEVLQVKLSAVR